MSELQGIDLRGRIMLHPPWNHCKQNKTVGRKSINLFPRPAEVIINILTAFKLNGGSIDELLDLLNRHIPSVYQKINKQELFNRNNFYSIEFHFYLVQFTKLLLNDIYFRYKIDEKTQLGEHYFIIEKGPMEFPPWIIDDGRRPDGYLSITNLASMFNYVEEGYLPPFDDGCDNAERGLKLSEEALNYLNSSASERYRVDRSFFDKEGILISFEYLFYGAAIFTSLTNDEFFVRHSHYYGYLHNNQLAKAIFLQPDLSPVEGFREWQIRTNNVYKMEFRSRYRTLWVTLHLRKQIQTGMFDLYQKNAINGIKQAAPAVYQAFLELATQKKVKTRIIRDKYNEYSFSVKIRWHAPHSAAVTYIAAGIYGAAIFFAAVYSRFVLPAHLITIFIAAALAAIVGGLTVVSLNWRNKLNTTKKRFKESKKVIDEQLKSLKNTTNELLAERDSLDKRVAERTAELNEALEKVKQLDRSKTNFIANVSHELRTPLTLLSVPLEAIKSGRYGKNIASNHPVFSLIARNVGRLKTQINQLLDFARLDLGTMTFELRQIELLSYCRMLIAELESLAGKKGLYLKLDNRTGSDELFIPADGNLLETALLNLLNNAFKFTDSGGITLILSEIPDHKEIRLIIEDTGIGFPLPEKERLFQRFTQAEGNKQRRSEGAGIGLALVKEIADLHGWGLDVEDRSGGGSSFSVTIPLDANQSFEFPVESQSLSGRALRQERMEAGLFISRPVTAGCCDSSSETILLIEDNPDMGELLQDLLRPEYNLRWCNGGNEALKWLETRPQLSLIISDVMMPGMSGFSFREEILGNDEYRDLPFVFITALADPEDRTEGLKSGAVDYIQKPFSASEFLLKIRNLIDSHRATYLQAVRDQSGAKRMERLTSGLKTEGKIPDWRVFGITNAEQRVAEQVRLGLQDKEIAAALSISPRTVSSHLSHLYQKTDTQNRVELINLLYQ